MRKKTTMTTMAMMAVRHLSAASTPAQVEPHLLMAAHCHSFLVAVVPYLWQGPVRLCVDGFPLNACCRRQA